MRINRLDFSDDVELFFSDKSKNLPNIIWDKIAAKFKIKNGIVGEIRSEARLASMKEEFTLSTYGNVHLSHVSVSIPADSPTLGRR